MPGYNHYSSCMCGWCYKQGANGYSRSHFIDNADKSFAKRKLKEHGVDRSWTACFVVPNATCPVCAAKVYYYWNSHGSSVFFDELGWPWPKHPCTDRSTSAARRYPGVPELRKRGMVEELLEAARVAEFDPNARFRSKYGDSPSDLLKTIETARQGFKNFIKAQSISPPLDEPVFLSFTSEKFIPAIGDYFSFSEKDVSFVNLETMESQSFRGMSITEEEFSAVSVREIIK